MGSYNDYKSLTGQDVMDGMKVQKLESWCLDWADDTLAISNLEVNDADRLKLAQAISCAFQRASLTIARWATGGSIAADDITVAAGHDTDSTPGSARRFPVKFEDLFREWSLERRPVPKTIYEWRRVLHELEAFLGHDDAGRVTAEDLIHWKAALIQQGRSPKTIRDAKLAPIRAIFRCAFNNRYLPVNPAERITIEIRARAGQGIRSFGDEEAFRILTAASLETDPVRRWVPWLCAYSGARISEVCQLRAEDVREVEGVWAIRFDPEAGPLKNKNSERLVPLHSEVIEAGFLEFAKAVQSGPLFTTLSPDKFGKRGGNGTKVIGRWVRSLGIKDPRISPSHSWRHQFKTLARRHDLALDLVDAMTGHAQRTVAAGYGEYPLVALQRELEKLPWVLKAGPVTPDPLECRLEGNAA